jgi:hypothetical protein
MQEPGSLEITGRTVSTRPDGLNRLVQLSTEFEYGVTSWWTTEVYIGGETSHSYANVLTGLEWENHFRLLRHDHWINPVLGIEFENTNGVDDAFWEVAGHDGKRDFIGPQDASGKSPEIEASLALSSTFKGWTVAENLIADKELRHAPVEFGYAVGVSRPLAVSAGREHCTFCRKNVQLGFEMYGGLGTARDFGLRDTSHYAAPLLAWTLRSGMTVRVSPGFGLTGTSAPFLLRFGVSYEFDDFGRAVRAMFRGSGDRPADNSF